jgi:hypothetical protein
LKLAGIRRIFAVTDDKQAGIAGRSRKASLHKLKDSDESDCP